VAVDSLVGRVAGISYLHIPARHPAASSAFYREVFGWPLHGSPDAPSFSDGTGHVIGRWVTNQAATGSDGLRAYIYVADVEQTLTAVVASGGQIVSPPYPEGTLRVALFADPAGNVLGIWQETAASLDSP
jgi:predicted enzyme related to lactoylglutathione lyase